MKKPRVVHIRDRRETGDIYIGRPSKWGNPFREGVDGTRAEVIAKYKGWIVEQKELMVQLPELSGRNLVCFCKPKPCHGDVLVELVSALCGRCRNMRPPMGNCHCVEGYRV